MTDKQKQNFITKSYPFLRIGLGCWLAYTLFFSACTRLPNVQGKGEIFLQGIWNEDTLGVQKQMQIYTQHHFKFTCDSFYLDFTTQAKVNHYGDECFNKGIWKEYAKGTYQVRNDSLFLVGDFTKANYKQKISGCYRSGQYINSFYIKQASPKHLELINAADGTTLKINLKQRITCVQKAL
jgi:hypothetical protein